MVAYKRANVANEWDAIVIGSGIGGLAPASLLARDGKRVLLLEQHLALGGCTQVFRRAGYEWDAGLHYMGEVHRPTSVLRRLFDAVSGNALDWAPMPDVYNRIVIGERGYDYPSGAAAFAARMKDYFPAEADAVDRYVDLVMAANKAAGGFAMSRALPPGQQADALAAGFAPFASRTVLDVLNELTDDPELIAVLCGHYGDYCMTPDKASFGMHAMLIRHYIDGASFPVGGSGRIADTAVAVIEAADGAALTGARVAEVLTEGSRAVGVRMADGRAFHAPVVISDAGAETTFGTLLGDREDTVELRTICDAADPSQCWLVMNIGLTASAAELALDGANLWVHASNDLVGNYARYVADPAGAPLPLHFLSYPSSKDPTWDARYPGRATIDLCSLTHWSVWERFAETDWKHRGAEYDALKAAMTEQMLDVIRRFHPQAMPHLDHVELATPLTFNHYLNRRRGDFMSMAHTPAKFGENAMGAHTPVAGLYLSGTDAASAGVSGALMGGVAAASAALGRNLLAEMRTR